MSIDGRRGAETAAGAPPALELRRITRRFPGIVANDCVSLELRRGEILALLGENGAGKTTLMNVVYGLQHADEGQVLVDGQPAAIRNPHDAIRLGIGMVHQHFMLVPVFSVAENVVLGQEQRRWRALFDREAANARVRALAQAYGLDLDPEAQVKDLPVGVQQRVEILKALYRQARILILDEPTAVLTPQEADELFGILRALARGGVSIIFITHKLREVLAVADRIAVLRGGRLVGETTPADTTEQELATMMVGRQVLLQVQRRPAEAAAPVLEVDDLHVAGDRGAPAVVGVSFQVRAGEVFGLAGVQGNGQTELVEALSGLRPVERGAVRLLGRAVTGQPPRRLIELGLAHIPEDRQRHGLVLSYPVAHNLVLSTYYRPPFARGPQLDHASMRRNALELVRQFDVRTASLYAATSGLSGGNQQKIIVAREFSRPIKFLLANQPTRGLDVGSIEYIHARLIEKRDGGCAVLLVSAELDEILALADRIGVMYRGRLAAVLDASAATKERLGLLMAGASPNQ